MKQVRAFPVSDSNPRYLVHNSSLDYVLTLVEIQYQRGTTVIKKGN